MTDNAFKARDIGLRAQKKILSRMANKTIAKTFIDGTTASLLDNIYRLAKLHVSFHKHQQANKQTNTQTNHHHIHNLKITG